MSVTWEVEVDSKASAKEIRAARVVAEAEAFAHGMSKDDVKIVFVMDEVPA